MLPKSIDYKKLLEDLDGLLVLANMLGVDQSALIVETIDNRIKFIARLNTRDIRFEDLVKIVTLLIKSRNIMKQQSLDTSAIDNAINEKLKALRKISKDDLAMMGWT